MCPHVDQSRVAPGRTAEGVSGKGRVPADRVGVLQSRRVVKLVDPLSLRHIAHTRLAPQGGAPAGRKGGRENVQGHSSEAAHLTSPQAPS